MKKLLYIILFIPFYVNGQSIPVTQVSFGTRADLRLQVGTANVQVFLNGLAAIGDGNGGTYMWNPASTVSDDGFTVIQVTGVTTGRWVRLVNSNTLKGNKVLSGAALQTAYTITFDNPLPTAPAMVLVQAYSAGAAQPSWISNATTTGFTVNFATVPIIGTLNLNISYLIIKQ